MMRTHLKKMWFVIISEALVNLYGYLYVQIIYLSPDKTKCHYFDHYAYNWSSIMERLVVDTLWTYPIIYIFWPNTRTWYGRLIQRRSSSVRGDGTLRTNSLKLSPKNELME